MISSFPPGKFQLLPLQAQADPASLQDPGPKAVGSAGVHHIAAAPAWMPRFFSERRD